MHTCAVSKQIRVTVLAGGFGGARMAHGFALLGDRVELSVIVNTADDLELHGLQISPDLDTVMYTLAGLANEATGWGVLNETWSASEMLERYARPTWFRLGDRDLATHIARTEGLRSGQRLTEVTAGLAASLAVRAALLPMTDDAVRTRLRTDDGWLDFQDYFVRRAHSDVVRELRFDGIATAHATAEVLAAIDAADLIVVAPSNPFVSVGPILALDGVRERLEQADAPVIAVSPIICGAAVRGPAAALLGSLAGLQHTSTGVATYYGRTYPGLLDVLVIDEADADQASEIAAAGVRPIVSRTLIGDPADRRRLAAELLELA